MSSSIFSHLIRVLLVSSFTTQRTRFHQTSSFFGHDHYQHHGIPGIPNDGKVVLLKNSSNGSQVYLVGIIHGYEGTTQTVKKVISYVRPNTVAIELCERRAREFVECIYEDDNLYTLYRQSRRAQGGLSTRVGLFIRNCLYLLRGEIISSNDEFRVAMDKASGVGARCFFIDQNLELINQKLVNLVKSSNSIWPSFQRFLEANRQREKDPVLYATRSSARELIRFWKDVSPETFRVYIEDRDKHMFMELRRFRGKIVAVVGMGHMDGIELLWNHAENGDDWQPLAN